MKTVTFITLCTIAAVCCFFAGVSYQKVGELQRSYNQAVLTQSALKDYQIDLYNDTVKVFDGDRFVGSYITTWKNQIDTILLKDNE